MDDEPHIIVMLCHGYAIGPFPNKAAADKYIETDPAGDDMMEPLPLSEPANEKDLAS